MYKEIDLLNLFVASLVRNGPLIAVPLENIGSNAVFICISGMFYAIKLPNSLSIIVSQYTCVDADST